MNRNKLLIKTAKFGKSHGLSINKIVAMFAAIIILFYIKDFICKIAGYILMPFRWIAGKIKAVILSVVSTVTGFCKRHRAAILQAELVLASAGILILVIFEGNVLDDVWGDENTGVFAQEQTQVSDEETDVNDIDANNGAASSEVEIKEPQPGYNISEEDNDTEYGNRPKYYIGLNRQLNTVTIYTYDKNGEYTVPVKAMRCATGGDNTPLGTFEVSDKFEFAPLDYNSYGQYCSRIIGVILFHSSTYTALRKDTLSAEDYNMLGDGVSHGCVRLTTADAKWIYDNCDKGTVVNIYDDDSAPGPLGKPDTIKVPDGTKWDPTDPDENNPWNDCKPVISGAVNRELYEHDTYDVLEGVTAVDTCGNDITEIMEIEGCVDVNMPGIYTVTYRVTDAIGRKDEVSVTVTVY